MRWPSELSGLQSADEAVERVERRVGSGLVGGDELFDGWRAGLMVTCKDPWEGRIRFEIAQYWALPPGRGHGRRLLEQGTRLADWFGAVLELEAMNSYLACGTYRRAGFENAAGSAEHRRPTMRRTPARLGGGSGLRAAGGHRARAGGR